MHTNAIRAKLAKGETEHVDLNSTALQSADFIDTGTQRGILVLTFKPSGGKSDGRAYAFDGVERERFQGFKRTKSAGRYYSKFIRGIYPSNKV